MSTSAPSNGSTSKAAGPLKLPHDIDAERAVLGAILLDNQVILQVIPLLLPEDFYHTAHQVIYEAILELYNTQQPIEPTLLIDQLRRTNRLEEAGGFLVIAGLEQFVMATGGTAHLAEVIKRKATARRLAKAAEEIYRQCAADTLEEEVLLDNAQAAVFGISLDTSKPRVKHVADLWQSTCDTIQSRRDGSGTSGLQLGYLDFDTRLLLSPTSLTIIGARPSIGKTAFGLNVAYNVARDGRPVLFFSLEMGEQQLVERLVARHMDIHFAKLLNPKYLTDWELHKVREAEAYIRQNLPIHIDDTPHLSAVRLSSACRQFCLRNKDTAAIVVDYLGLMELPQTRNSNRNLELGELSRALKLLAKELEVPVIALHQLSRDVEKRSTERKAAKPRLSDLRESGHLEEDADNVLFLHRERSDASAEQMDPERAVRKIVECQVIVAKQRAGAIFSESLVFDMSVGAFRNREKKAGEVAE